MINKFSVAKAFRDRSDATAAASGIRLVGAGEGYKSDPEEEFIEEMVLFGDDNPVGISDTSSDIMVGVYQINANVPIAERKWAALILVDTWAAAFPKGLKLTHNLQMVRVRKSYISPMITGKTHLTYILSIEFTVIN
jgi:hypothetical protein